MLICGVCVSIGEICVSSAIAACCQPISARTIEVWNVFSVFYVWAWPRPPSHLNLHLHFWLDCFDSRMLLHLYGLLSFWSLRTKLSLCKMSRGKARDPIHSADALWQSLTCPLGPAPIWNNYASIHLVIIDQCWLVFMWHENKRGYKGVQGPNIFLLHYGRSFCTHTKLYFFSGLSVPH